MLSLIKKTESALFYLFIFSIPLEKRHVFETSFSRIDEHFIEWNSAALYLSDILLGFLILFWIIRLVKKGVQLSIGSWTPFLIFFVFILISLISSLNSQYINLSLYHTAKLFEYGLLFFYVICNIKTIQKITSALLVFIFSGFLQAILGISQYLKQGSFNLKIFGEVDLSPALLNISKIDVAGDKLIRAYGTFPHSNVLACFLFISIIFTIFIIFLIFNNKEAIHDFYLQKFIKLPVLVFILYILSLGLLLTFSRSAWLALILSILFSILFLSFGYKTFITKQFKNDFSKLNIIITLIVFIAVTVIIFWPQISSRNIGSNPADEYSLSGRTLYNELSGNIVKDNLLLGIGPGLFVYHLAQYLPEGFVWWQMQPVHNVYLLIFAEQGILGFIAFITFIVYILSRIGKFDFKQKGNNVNNQILIIFLSSVLFSLFIIMLFDHYLWDIQQGSLCFFLILGLFYSSLHSSIKQ